MLTFPCFWTEDGACACPAGVECKTPGKHPLTANGVKDASIDPETLATWRKRWPKAHWAVATGATAGLIVVDLDRKPGKDGIANFAKLGTVPQTLTVRTGSGGLHLYLRHPGGRVANSASKLAPGVDVRGENGYVIGPGSGHVSGGRYETLIDVEPADCPAWLAELLQGGKVHPAPSVSPLPSSPIHDLAREAIRIHGPAVEGRGGDQHTFRAAAILVNDFALSEDEAWPLFLEWNTHCQPPWDESSLRAKLAGGVKYATHPRGCKRPFSPLEASKVAIREWHAAGRGDLALTAMVAGVREYAKRCTDPTEVALIEKELIAETGLKKRDLAMPQLKHPPANVKQGEILVSTELHTVADASVEAIADHVFQRMGVLCEVVTGGSLTFIQDLESARIQDLMSKCSRYVRADEKGTVSVAAPERVATILHARRGHPVRQLDAITTAPIFLADGSILSERGYNPVAKVYLEPSVAVELPAKPTHADAVAAIQVLTDLVCDFQFASPADLSSWLAGLLSPLVKAATGNAPVPLICVSASSAGAGKTLLTDLIARIVTGGPAEIRGYGTKDPGEWGKRLTAFVKAASPVSVFDNVDGVIGDGALDRLITSATWSDRLLGASDAPPLANVSTWFATGNNIEPVGDTIRRVLVVRVVVDVEKPQERTDFKRKELGEYVQAHRAELLEAALTVLKAYHLAGRPDQNLPSWGSFTTWSALVRGALVWAGCADPFLTQQRASAVLGETDNEIHDFWIDVVESSDGSNGDIVVKANQREAAEVLGTRDLLTAYRLKKFLARFIDKPRGGKRLLRKAQRYVVDRI